MTISTSHASYSDCYSVMDQAIADPNGIRISFLSRAEAIFFRMRCHQARAIDRRRSKEVYVDPTHPMHGTSLYDKIVLRIYPIDEVVWLYLEQLSIEPNRIELLSEVKKQIFLPAPATPLMIESPAAFRRRI